jgi:hypothetical protein
MPPTLTAIEKLHTIKISLLASELAINPNLPKNNSLINSEKIYNKNSVINNIPIDIIPKYKMYIE